MILERAEEAGEAGVDAFPYEVGRWEVCDCDACGFNGSGEDSKGARMGWEGMETSEKPTGLLLR